jgi:hypothetical protein
MKINHKITHKTNKDIQKFPKKVAIPKKTLNKKKTHDITTLTFIKLYQIEKYQ